MRVLVVRCLLVKIFRVFGYGFLKLFELLFEWKYFLFFISFIVKFVFWNLFVRGVIIMGSWFVNNGKVSDFYI